MTTLITIILGLLAVILALLVLAAVKGEKLYARTYDKGWNQPNVRYWLDAKLPYEKEEEQ